MRYEKGHKAETRQKILETASREFRRRGLEGIGVADIMNKAGLTHGGFYSHFSSKEDLVRQSMGSSHSPDQSTAFRHEGQVRPVEDIIRFYLSPRHRDHPEKGCTAAALVEEVGRQPKEVRAAFTDAFSEKIDMIQAGLPVKFSTELKRKKALAIFSIIMGALQLSRSLSDPETSDQILQAGIESALKIATEK